MRRGTLVILGVLMASVAVPNMADARPRDLPGALFGFFTNPIGTIMNARHGRRSYPRPRRAKAPSPNPGSNQAASPAATTPPNPADPATAVAGAAAAGAVAATAAGHAAASAVSQPADAGESAGTPVVPVLTGTEAAVPIPAPAPAERNAALSQPAAASGADTKPHPAPSGKLGIAGPSDWPDAYEDVIGFTFWPQDYGARLRGHGIGDVLATTLAPAANSRTGAADGPCGAAPPAAWPAADLARGLSLNAEQRSALDRLQTVLADTAASIHATTCRDRAAASPGERLQGMQNTLWAVHDAAVSLRAPLAKFYDLLNDAQKKQLAGSADPRAASRDDMARLCGAPADTAPMRNFEQALQPTKAQRASLDAFQKKSFEMGQFLMASCLQPIAATPTERLDAAADRLTAVIFAASSVGLALDDVYSQLTDRQKAKLAGSGS